MAVNNLYQVMGVAQNASDQDIKHAYRRLARKYHPDLNKEKNAEEKFKELGAAYEILKDPARRKNYDQFLAGSTQRPAAGADAGAYAEDLQDQGFGGFSGNEDLFTFIFGQGGC